jgi:spore germination protein KA
VIDETRSIINSIVSRLGPKSTVIVKSILIGKNSFIPATILYVDLLTDANVIDERILESLMFRVDETSLPKEGLLEFISQKYITRGDTEIEQDIEKVVDALNHGRTAIILDGYTNFIVVNTKGGEYRPINEPVNESPIRGTREGFVEDVEVNISMIKRIVKDDNLRVKYFKVGRRSKTDLALVYIDDIVDKDLLDEIKSRISRIDVDMVGATGILEQYIEDSTYSPFPQMHGTERPDRIVSKIMEGRVAFILSGTPFVITAPALFQEFMQAPEDYYQRTLVSSFISLVRYLAISLIIFLSPVYLTLISYNVELIPITFITPIAESRQAVPLSPFLEILVMELVIELLREGGLRLPPKIAQTISIVGGIIIGNAAIQSRVVSPSTLLVVGVSTIASFLIPNYEMAASLRIIKFSMLIIADAMGFLGIAAGCFFLITHMFSLKSFGVPYFTFTKHDMRDLFIRAPLWMMNKRPDAIPNNNPIRQRDFRKGSGGEKNE